MIKVLEDGAPVSAISSIEFNDRWVDSWWRRELYAPAPFKLPCTEAEARRLRDEWVKQWPEVAEFIKPR